MKLKLSKDWYRQKLAMWGEEPMVVGSLMNTKEGLFPNAKEEIADGTCPTCHKPITDLDDELSEKEYQVSGMCQECQDKIFVED